MHGWMNRQIGWMEGMGRVTLQELKAMMRDSTEERARKRRRTKVGGEVPADSDKFVTPAVQKVRDRAAKRQVAKERVGQTTSSTKARAQRGATRWVGRPSRVGQTTGPSPVGQTTELAGNPAANPWAMLEHTDILLPKNSDTDLYDLFSRRRFYVLRSVAELAERATRKRVPPSRRVMVLPTLRPNTLNGDSKVVWCRIFGGFLTSSQWLQEGIANGKPPKAIPFRGINTKRTLTMYLSDQFKDQCKESSVALTVLAQEAKTMKIVESLKAIREHCVKYKEDKGLTSRPWSCTVILVPAEADVEPIRQQAGVDVPAQVVRTLEEFLIAFSTVQKELVCPGPWPSSLR